MCVKMRDVDVYIECVCVCLVHEFVTVYNTLVVHMFVRRAKQKNRQKTK